jgi:hypothetical protein
VFFNDYNLAMTGRFQPDNADEQRPDGRTDKFKNHLAPPLFGIYGKGHFSLTPALSW